MNLLFPFYEPPVKMGRHRTYEDSMAEQAHYPIKHLAESSFHQDIQADLILVDFYADWCGPCRAMTPVLEKVAEEFKGKAVIAKLNIDDAQGIAAQYQVTSIPTLILYKKGTEAGRLVGLRDAAAIKKFLEN